MFRNIVLASAAALGLGLASYAVPATEALAAAEIKKTQSAKHTKVRSHQKKFDLSGRGNGRQKGCFEAECPGGHWPVHGHDKYVVGGCNLTPAGSPLPPHCK